MIYIGLHVSMNNEILMEALNHGTNLMCYWVHINCGKF